MKEANEEIIKEREKIRNAKLNKVDYSKFLCDIDKEHFLFIEDRKIKIERIKRLEIIYRREVLLRTIIKRDALDDKLVADYVRNRKSLFLSLNDGENMFKATPGYMHNAIGETRHFENRFDLHINLVDMESPEKIKFDFNRFELMEL